MTESGRPRRRLKGEDFAQNAARKLMRRLAECGSKRGPRMEKIGMSGAGDTGSFEQRGLCWGRVGGCAFAGDGGVCSTSDSGQPPRRAYSRSRRRRDIYSSTIERSPPPRHTVVLASNAATSSLVLPPFDSPSSPVAHSTTSIGFCNHPARPSGITLASTFPLISAIGTGP